MLNNHPTHDLILLTHKQNIYFLKYFHLKPFIG